ncbi:hypothetical protein XBI1_1420100 [Xenorhabdus bovienii str. Intermedium]|uniref:LysR substrate-binding domain-containing protein n=1 Tax=Xenorhabdus bovienii str. Intermedium TaxID=1379677 RepID=A0A077Q5H5_XENBV|nr:hypothetical protein XBI1_1420100 [Xenorhabdus bovienii str. Intermedium]
MGNALKTSSERAVLSFVEEGIGIGSALNFACIEKVRAKKLIPILEDWTYPIPLYIIYHSKSYLHKYIREFIEVFFNEINEERNIYS